MGISNYYWESERVIEMDEIEQMNEREKFFTDGLEDDGMKLINRISHNGKMISEHMTIDPPKELTIQWDAEECEIKMVTQGEVILKKRG